VLETLDGNRRRGTGTLNGPLDIRSSVRRAAVNDPPYTLLGHDSAPSTKKLIETAGSLESQLYLDGLVTTVRIEADKVSAMEAAPGKRSRKDAFACRTLAGEDLTLGERSITRPLERSGKRRDHRLVVHSLEREAGQLKVGSPGQP
jgi:hypothetical protein